LYSVYLVPLLTCLPAGRLKIQRIHGINEVCLLVGFALCYATYQPLDLFQVIFNKIYYYYYLSFLVLFSL
jgi:hypothetical protein